MYRDHRMILEFIAKIIYHKFPDRPDRRLSIGDCCNSGIPCPGHPGGSHQNYRTMDHNYYTFGLSNTTQYRAGIQGEDIEYDYVFIWENGITPVNLQHNIFDWERNYYLWLLIDKIFPGNGTIIMTQSEISNYMYDEIKSKYGRTAATEHLKRVSVTSGGTWNHHIHAHISLDRNINWDFDFGEFQKEMNELEAQNN